MTRDGTGSDSVRTTPFNCDVLRSFGLPSHLCSNGTLTPPMYSNRFQIPGSLASSLLVPTRRSSPVAVAQSELSLSDFSLVSL